MSLWDTSCLWIGRVVVVGTLAAAAFWGLGELLWRLLRRWLSYRKLWDGFHEFMCDRERNKRSKQ